jgi:hypothetical protein
VRAGLCRTAADWKWSSFAATLDLVEPPPFLAVDAILPLFSRTAARARARYRAFVADAPARAA